MQRGGGFGKGEMWKDKRGGRWGLLLGKSNWNRDYSTFITPFMITP